MLQLVILMLAVGRNNDHTDHQDAPLHHVICIRLKEIFLRTLNKVYIACAVLVGVEFSFVQFGSSNEAFAKKAGQANKSAWASVCLKDKKKNVLGCRLTQRVLLKIGKKGNKGDKIERPGLLLAIQIRRPKAAKPYIHLHLPLGLALPAGAALSVMDGKSKKAKITYKTAVQTCVAQGCFATLPLEPKLLKAIKTGKTMRVSFMNANKKTIYVPITLKGFSKAYSALNKKVK